MQLNWSCDLSSLDTVKFLSFFYIKQIANLCKASEMKNMPLWRQLTTDFSGLKIPHSIFNTGAWNHTWIVNIHISSMSWKWSVEIKKKKLWLQKCSQWISQFAIWLGEYKNHTKFRRGAYLSLNQNSDKNNRYTKIHNGP